MDSIVTRSSAALLFLVAGACSTFPEVKDDIDTTGILRQLNTLFSGNCPKAITVTRGNKRRSEFHTRNASIELGTDADGFNEETVLTHEATHLCMANLTHGASKSESYRFYDEGFANIVGGGYSDSYRERALAVASRKAGEGEVSFIKVQKWSKYFGDPPRTDYDAYDVGASFIFFVQDTYGKEKLFAFFRATGTEPSLDAACKSAFGDTSTVVEQKWLAYLNR